LIEDTYFLVRTTTPWTLISNVALCVNPKEEYILVESMGYKFILAKKLASSVLGDDYQIIKTYLGKDLEHKKYEQLLPFINIDNAFYVTNDEYVTMEEGTGIVHIAPAFGEDDYNIGKRYNLPVINPVNEEGRYTTGPWKEFDCFDADLEIIKMVKRE
jgi:isoleucyl-tRNA synthetase